MIKKGDIVRVKPQWMDKGEENLTFVARSDEELGRFDMSCLELSHWPLWPTQVTRVDMVEETGQRLNEKGEIVDKGA